MSLRPRRHPEAGDIGCGNYTSVLDVEDTDPITVAGVTISSDPQKWSSLSNKDIMKLELNPMDMDPKDLTTYFGIAFISPYNKTHKFYVEKLRYVPIARLEIDPEWHLLARPLTDPYNYYPNASPWMEK